MSLERINILFAKIHLILACLFIGWILLEVNDLSVVLPPALASLLLGMYYQFKANVLKAKREQEELKRKYAHLGV